MMEVDFEVKFEKEYKYYIPCPVCGVIFGADGKEDGIERFCCIACRRVARPCTLCYKYFHESKIKLLKVRRGDGRENQCCPECFAEMEETYKAYLDAEKNFYNKQREIMIRKTDPPTYRGKY